MPRRRPPAPHPAAPDGLTSALIYARVSSDEQARDGTSLPTQLRDCRQYVARQAGWTIHQELLDVESGLHDSRAGYQALLAEARRLRAAGQPAVVVVAALDRFGRRILERVRSREELKALGIETHSVREGGAVSDLVAHILAAVAQEESRRTGERISAAFRYIQQSGWHAGGRVPWGYVWRDATGLERTQGAPRRVPALDDPVAPYVVETFERIAGGASIRQTALWVRALLPALRRGRSLTVSMLAESLRLRTYIAQLPDGTPGRWPALVTVPLWERVQERLVEHQRVPHQASGRYLLTGFLRCPRCGGRMVGGKDRKGNSYYVCARQTSYGDCNESASGARLDRLARDAVVVVIVPLLSARPPALRAAWERLHRETAAPARPSPAAGHRAARLRERLRRAASLYADGAMDREGYELVREEVRAELAAADRLRPPAPPVPTPLALPPLNTVLAGLATWQGADVPAQREVLRLLVDSLTYARLRYGVYELRIEWTELGETLQAFGSG